MQTAGRKQRSAVDNLIILNSIIENQRKYKNKTYLFFADARKCFDKLRLKDCLIEMYNLGYSPGRIRSLHKINKTSNIVVDIPLGKNIKHNCRRSSETRNHIWPNYVLCINIKSK